MARKSSKTPATTAIVEAGISAKVRKMIDGFRAKASAYAKEFGGLTKRREELARPFMAAYSAWTKEVEAAGRRASFVAFCRVVDPSIPSESQGPMGYKANSAYQAFDYLRRKDSSGQAGAGRSDTGNNRAKPLRGNLSFVGRMSATLLQVVSDPADFWKGITSEFGVTGQRLTKLQTLVSQSQPFMQLTAIKKQPFKLVHVEAATAAAAPEMAAGKRKAG